MDSFLARHRTICAVLTELRDGLSNGTFSDDVIAKEAFELVDEALDYARRMSAKLMSIKAIEEKDKPVTLEDALMVVAELRRRLKANDR